MGQYVTPRGVVVEVNDEAARVVGYRPVEADVEVEASKPTPARRKRAAKNPAGEAKE